MNAEEFIRLGKERLQEAGLVEDTVSSKDSYLFPSLPGLGAAGGGISHRRNRAALAKYYIQPALIGDDFLPSTSLELFGQHLSTPILAAPMSGIAKNLHGLVEETEFLSNIVEGCADAGTLAAFGDSYDTTENYLGSVVAEKGLVLPVLKPRSLEAIDERIRILSQGKIVAVGIDLDGVTGLLLETRGVERKSETELKKIRELSEKPMFLKGILSIEDAFAAHRAGFDGIVVSNHGGRSLDYLPGVAIVLPLVAKELKGKIKIFADGGVQNGYDAFVYLALGADAILVGRTLLYAAVGGGRAGVKATVNKLTADLARAMVFTECRNLDDIGSRSVKLYG